METQEMNNKGMGVAFGIIAAIGGIIGVWSIVTLMSGLASVNWQVTEMVRQFLVATGNLGEYETMVDYYTHIKGVEYIIAVVFFAAFPVFTNISTQKRRGYLPNNHIVYHHLISHRRMTGSHAPFLFQRQETFAMHPVNSSV
jgi:hypothetical protein